MAHVRFFIEKPDVYDVEFTGSESFFLGTDTIAHLNQSTQCKVFCTFSKFQPKNLGGTVAYW